MRIFAALLIAVAVSLPASAALANEHANGGDEKEGEAILDFQVRIEVLEDGRLDIVEHIRFRALGEQIRKGLIRSLPGHYQGPGGLELPTQVEVIEVLRNGEAEPWTRTPRESSFVMRIGNAASDLDLGVHEYTLHYRITGQVSESRGTSGLTWAVTGFGGTLPVHRAGAEVSLPRKTGFLTVIPDLSADVAPGDAQVLETEFAGHRASVLAPAGLAPQENLRLSLTWPSGAVARSGTWRDVAEHHPRLAASAGAAVFLLFVLAGLLNWIVRGSIKVRQDRARRASALPAG